MRWLAIWRFDQPRPIMDLPLDQAPQTRGIGLPKDDSGQSQGRIDCLPPEDDFWCSSGEIWGAANRRLVCAKNGRALKCSYRNILDPGLMESGRCRGFRPSAV